MTRVTTPTITVVKPGWCTTVQDGGRNGYRRYGVPISGAMDGVACTVANRLVGNHDGEASLEITLNGPTLRFEREAVIAVTGANLSPLLDGEPISLWTSVSVPAGGQLVFGARQSGSRAYLALAGGIDVPLCFASRATDITSGMGGVDGRPLIKGDVLHGGSSVRSRTRPRRMLPTRWRPNYGRSPLLRVLPGPQQKLFDPDVFDALVSAPYILSSQSNRMGYRLTGPRLQHVGTAKWISDGTVPGALQVPSNEQPILLMKDCQTTGGYPKPAVVVTADLHLAGQVAPGDSIRFSITTFEEARAALKTLWRDLNRVLPPHPGSRG